MRLEQEPMPGLQNQIERLNRKEPEKMAKLGGKKKKSHLTERITHISELFLDSHVLRRYQVKMKLLLSAFIPDYS